MQMLLVIKYISLFVIATLITSCAAHNHVIQHEYPHVCSTMEYRGTLDECMHKCSVNGPTERRMYVYLPKEYNLNDSLRYPVLYLLHGARGNELSWIERGNILHNIDSLSDNKLMKDMIIVMPNVNQYDNDEDFGKSRAKGAVESLFETDGCVESAFVDDVVGTIDSLYRTIPTKQYRAIAGLSIGAMQAIHISANNPDTFGYIGAFSAMINPMLRKSEYSTFYKDLKDKMRVQFSTPPLLYSLYIGRGDFYYPRMRLFAHYLERCDYNFEIHIVKGGHQWYNWQAFANHFIQNIF